MFMSRAVLSRPFALRYAFVATASLLILLGSLALVDHASAATYAPVAEYSFDEGEAAGATIEDQAGENDGTLEGATRTGGR